MRGSLSMMIFPPSPPIATKRSSGESAIECMSWGYRTVTRGWGVFLGHIPKRDGTACTACDESLMLRQGNATRQLAGIGNKPFRGGVCGCKFDFLDFTVGYDEELFV